MKMKGGAAALAALCLAGCDAQPDSGAGRAAAKLPAKVCAQAREAVEKLVAQGGVEVDGKGGATVMEEAWIPMGADRRDQLVQLLGYDAACRASEPSIEQKVTIRNEYGRVMSDRIVETGVDISALLEE
jgi:hypothetical protein